MVGGTNFANGMEHGILVRDGNCIQIEFPGSIGGYANGITSKGDIVGRYHSLDGSTHGFLLAKERTH
jgi:hypothetical protein